MSESMIKSGVGIAAKRIIKARNAIVFGGIDIDAIVVELDSVIGLLVSLASMSDGATIQTLPTNPKV